MPKIRLIRIMVKEYTPDPEYYPKDMTIEEMAQNDTNADDRELLFEDCKSDVVRWEVVEDDDPDEQADIAQELLDALKYARRFLNKENHDTDYVDEIILKAKGTMEKD